MLLQMKFQDTVSDNETTWLNLPSFVFHFYSLRTGDNKKEE